MNITIKNINEMDNLARFLAYRAVPNDVLLLNGDLGAGKTTFSQFFGKALGVKRKINSPTFNIIKSYTGRLTLHHMDCYRLKEAEEDLGFDEYFFDEGVTLLEWPEMIDEFLPDDYLEITIKVDTSNTMQRNVKLRAKGTRYEKLLEELKHEITSY